MIKRTAFLGSKKIGYECLRLAISNKNLDFVGVLTAPKNLLDGADTIYELCNAKGIPVLSSLEELLGRDVDILISVQYHEILKQRHIAIAKEIAINLHMAPLPEYRGCNQFSFAIIDQRKEFGTTIHRLEEGIDSGDILFEQRFQIPENCFVQDLYQLTFQNSVELFKRALPELVGGQYSVVPQSVLEMERGSSYHFRNEIDAIKKIDPTWEIEKQKRHFRATWFPPFSPPFSIINGDKVELDMDWYDSLTQRA